MKIAMTPEEFKAKALELSQHYGINVPGPHGTLTHAGATVEYSYDGEILDADVTHKPFFVSEAYADKMLADWFCAMPAAASGAAKVAPLLVAVLALGALALSGCAHPAFVHIQPVRTAPPTTQPQPVGPAPVPQPVTPVAPVQELRTTTGDGAISIGTGFDQEDSSALLELHRMVAFYENIRTDEHAGVLKLSWAQVRALINLRQAINAAMVEERAYVLHGGGDHTKLDLALSQAAGRYDKAQMVMGAD